MQSPAVQKLGSARDTRDLVQRAPGERGSSSVLALLVSTPHSIPVTANLPPPTISCHLTALQRDSGRVTRPDRLLSGELVRQQPLPLISAGAHLAELLPNAAVAAPAAPAAPTTGANQPLSTGLGFCCDFTYHKSFSLSPRGCSFLPVPQRFCSFPSIHRLQHSLQDVAAPSCIHYLP